MKPPKYDDNWPADVMALYKHDMDEIWDRSRAPHMWNQYHNQLDIYREIAGLESKSILDVGCAQGTLALLLAEDGHQVTAVDIRQQFLDYAATRYTHGDIKFLRANVLEDEITGEFDVIFANQIVEHLVYPETLTKRLSELLTPGGKLVMSTPNGKYLKNSLPSFSDLGDPSQWEHMQHTADGDGHFYAYLPIELVEIFENSGLVDVSYNVFETPFISGHMKLRYLHNILPYALLRAGDRALLSVPKLRDKASHQLLVTGRKPA